MGAVYRTSRIPPAHYRPSGGPSPAGTAPYNAGDAVPPQFVGPGPRGVDRPRASQPREERSVTKVEKENLLVVRPDEDLSLRHARRGDHYARRARMSILYQRAETGQGIGPRRSIPDPDPVVQPRGYDVVPATRPLESVHGLIIHEPDVGVLSRASYEKVVGYRAGRVRVYRRIQVEAGREGRSLRGPQLQRLVVRAREERVRVEGIEGEVGYPVGVAASALLAGRPRNRAHGSERVDLVRVGAAFEVPELDVPLCAARDQETTIELIYREAADAGAMGADVVRPVLDDGRLLIWCQLAIEAMLRCWCEEAKQFCGVGEREVAGRQVTRLAGKKASLHSSELCGRESCDSRDPEVGFQELMDGGVLMLMTWATE
ncbi:unnamed protein product [Clonostachys rosea f. rosea IK726]|uniref:Uncharacterized protein n=1 Tax=Clonostachys rosea f. rosea IK726 TaxID=1349383 RepID=A0ACA9TSD7_BIOOC|nr:unnamed protein product [Clonostachys rosea f. rosea IK726]